MLNDEVGRLSWCWMFNIRYWILRNYFTFAIQFPGEVSEWSKEHAWKVCIRQKCIEGSNPSLSALSYNGLLKH